MDEQNSSITVMGADDEMVTVEVLPDYTVIWQWDEVVDFGNLKVGDDIEVELEPLSAGKYRASWIDIVTDA